MSYRNVFDLSGQKTLVVGPVSGIGAAAAEGFGAFCGEVICADINRDSREDLPERIRLQGGKVVLT
jgi:NAD(P)-dependent dehydrogenase (short-subunit alcohol dehydrogenase family)